MMKMKSKIGFLIALTVILSSIVYFYSRSKSATLPDPILINFEKQKVASFSDFWSIYDKDGSEVSFKKFKKKVLFICYVSTKSEESLKQLESLKKVYDDYKTKMDFLLLSNDNQTKMIHYLDDNEYYFPLYFYLSEPPKEFEVKKLPQSYLISKKGRILVDSNEAVKWDSTEFRKVLDGLISSPK